MEDDTSMRKGRDLSAKLKATYAREAFSVMGNSKATKFIFNWCPANRC